MVCCYARCVQKGTTSVSINIEVWVKKWRQNQSGNAIKQQKHYLSMSRLIPKENLAPYPLSNNQSLRSEALTLCLLNFGSAVNFKQDIHHNPTAWLTRLITPSAHRIFTSRSNMFAGLAERICTLSTRPSGVTSNLTLTCPSMRNACARAGYCG